MVQSFEFCLLKKVIGREADFSSKRMRLSHQGKYIEDLLHKTNMHMAKPIQTPMATIGHLSTHDGVEFENPTLYRSTVESLQYLSFTCPDLAYVVNRVCQYMHAPSIPHCSTGGLCIHLGSHLISSYLISWSFRKQPMIARSSTKAKYKAMAIGTCKLLWIQSLLHDLGVPLPAPSVLWCDNLGAT